MREVEKNYFRADPRLSPDSSLKCRHQTQICCSFDTLSLGLILFDLRKIMKIRILRYYAGMEVEML